MVDDIVLQGLSTANLKSRIYVVQNNATEFKGIFAA